MTTPSHGIFVTVCGSHGLEVHIFSHFNLLAAGKEVPLIKNSGGFPACYYSPWNRLGNLASDN